MVPIEEEKEKELQRTIKDGLVVKISDYKVKTLWKQVIENYDLPNVEAYLFKTDFIEPIRNLMLSSYPEEKLKNHYESMKKEYQLKDYKQVLTFGGLCIPSENGYVIAIADKPRNNHTVDQILLHELRHVMEFEVLKLQRKGEKIHVDDKVLKPDEKFLLNKNLLR
jgi:hypothetical protein